MPIDELPYASATLNSQVTVGREGCMWCKPTAAASLIPTNKKRLPLVSLEPCLPAQLNFQHLPCMLPFHRISPLTRPFPHWAQRCQPWVTCDLIAP